MTFDIQHQMMNLFYGSPSSSLQNALHPSSWGLPLYQIGHQITSFGYGCLLQNSLPFVPIEDPEHMHNKIKESWQFRFNPLTSSLYL